MNAETIQAVDDVFERSRQQASDNRRTFTVISVVLVLALVVDSTLSEWQTRRITRRLETTPSDVRSVVEKLIEVEQEEIAAFSESLYFLNVLESSSDAFVQIDSGGFIGRWSAGAQEMFGYGKQEVIGMHISILMPPDQQSLHRDQYAATMRLEKSLNRRRLVETYAVNSTGDKFPIRLSLWIAPGVGAVAKVTQLDREPIELSAEFSSDGFKE